MDTIECISNAIKNSVEGVEIIPCGNGGIRIDMEDAEDTAAVLACIADMMWDYKLEDVQITTNQAKYQVFVDIIEREDEEEEDPELWPEDELEMKDRPVPIKKGDLIWCCSRDRSRVNIAKVLLVITRGAWVEGPYEGEVQVIDWEDIQKYNPDFYDDSDDSEEEVEEEK